MKFLAAALVLLFRTSASHNITWTIPPNLPDGLYAGIHREDDMGQTRLFLERNGGMEASAAFDPHANGSVLARALPLRISRLGCIDPAVMLDSDDLWASKQALYNWCKSGRAVHTQVTQLALKGTVAVWICSYGVTTPDSPCPLDELKAADRIFNETCGEQRGGFLSMREWDKTYGRHGRTEPFDCLLYR